MQKHIAVTSTHKSSVLYSKVELFEEEHRWSSPSGGILSFVLQKKERKKKERKTIMLESTE